MTSKIDCLGDMCPLPLLKIQQQMKQILNGEVVMIVTDHSCSMQNITEFCHASKLNCDVNEVMRGVWEISVYQTNK